MGSTNEVTLAVQNKGYGTLEVQREESVCHECVTLCHTKCTHVAGLPGKKLNWQLFCFQQMLENTCWEISYWDLNETVKCSCCFQP